jgi:LPXTG-motif cell wall-anchored protein
MQYIIDNKEWIFSGIGVAILSVIIGFILRKRKKKIVPKLENKNNDKITRTINQYGKKSVYIEKIDGKIKIS